MNERKQARKKEREREREKGQKKRWMTQLSLSSLSVTDSEKSDALFP